MHHPPASTSLVASASSRWPIATRIDCSRPQGRDDINLVFECVWGEVEIRREMNAVWVRCMRRSSPRHPERQGLAEHVRRAPSVQPSDGALSEGTALRFEPPSASVDHPAVDSPRTQRGRLTNRRADYWVSVYYAQRALFVAGRRLVKSQGCASDALHVHHYVRSLPSRTIELLSHESLSPAERNLGRPSIRDTLPHRRSSEGQARVPVDRSLAASEGRSTNITCTSSNTHPQFDIPCV
ncbi:hypothetical protein PsYK624_130520 [Phanerochaete sordida]|uniref:Uncharacterized protein n=1 Tax=Phanerochaete sordida TaxID=48140 RepID=A0A9P3GKE7_9APHY|nr:hypothetical protein PsYK624_130520 [Phanerochaete sordida]